MTVRNDKARIRILESYERAKKVDPTITQGQFMRSGAPGSRVEGLVGRFRSDDSAARYFRKIRSGERTGGAMYEQGRAKGTLGSFQFRIKLGRERYITQNVAIAGTSSTFDIAAVEYEMKHRNRASVEKLIATYRAKYGMEQHEIDMDSLEVRQITKVHKPYRIWGAIDDYGY